jgi:hypothetical protein
MKKTFDLHSGPRFKKFDIGNGVSEEWHKDKETGETVILHSWWVSDGDCVSGEFEVVEVIPAGGLVGQLKRLLGIN